MLRSTTYVMSSWLLRPENIKVHVRLLSTDAFQFGKLLTPEEVATRRAERGQRRAATVENSVETDMTDALFIEGSVRHYQRHYVIVEPEGTDQNAWPAKLEQSPQHLLSRYMAALKDLYGGDLRRLKKSPLLLTAAIPYTGMDGSILREDGTIPTKTREDGHDLLVFPECVRVLNVGLNQIIGLVRRSLVTHREFYSILDHENLKYTQMEQAYQIMVCGHTARDKRCGCKGPELLQWLQNLAPEAKKPFNLWLSSHYGGHRYAANCIVYPQGDWFGLVNDEDKAKRMLNAVSDEDPLRVYELWRGRVGLTVQEMLQAVKQRTANVDALSAPK